MQILREIAANGGSIPVPPELDDVLAVAEGGVLYVATMHIADHRVLAFIDQVQRVGIQLELKKVSHSEIKRLHGPKSDASATDATRASGDTTYLQDEIVRYVRDAVKLRASDIHFIVTAELCLIRMRVHGELQTIGELSKQHGKDICATIYQSMCDVADPVYNPGKSQDGRLRAKYVNQCGLYGARVATCPTDDGVLMVLRLLYGRRHGTTHSLMELGYLSEQVAYINLMTQRKTGINILSGPTGSGKSTTLECILSGVLHRYENKIHLLTVENPPEYPIPGAVQTPIVCDKYDETELQREWARSIASSLRLDPDVIMIGEVRDQASATAALRAAMTGHSVWTTLHANDSISVLDRLRDFDIDINLLTDSALITGLNGQRLVRRICRHCRLPYSEHGHVLPDDLVERVEKYCDPESVFLKGKGCTHCRETGIEGRIVVAEVIVPTHSFMTIYRQSGAAEARVYWARKMGGITKTMHMIHQINNGLVDPQLAERDVGMLNEDAIQLEL